MKIFIGFITLLFDFCLFNYFFHLNIDINTIFSIFYMFRFNNKQKYNILISNYNYILYITIHRVDRVGIIEIFIIIIYLGYNKLKLRICVYIFV